MGWTVQAAVPNATSSAAAGPPISTERLMPFKSVGGGERLGQLPRAGKSDRGTNQAVRAQR